MWHPPLEQVEEQEFVDSFKPTLMEVVAAWGRGVSFAEVLKMTSVFEVRNAPGNHANGGVHGLALCRYRCLYQQSNANVMAMHTAGVHCALHQKAGGASKRTI